MRKLIKPNQSKPSCNEVTPVEENICHLNDLASDSHFVVPSEKMTSIYGGVSGSLPVSSDPAQDRFPSPSQSAAANSANWSTSVQTLLDQPPATFPLKLILGGIGFCLAFGAWAWLGQIEQVGHAQGRLIPKGQVHKVDPVEPGKVIRVAVKAGQEVRVGQLLVELDSQLAKGEIERLQQSLTANQIQLSQMQGLIERIQLEAKTREATAAADIQAQAAAIAQAKETAATTRELLTQLQADAKAHQARQQRLEPFVREGALSKDFLFEAEQALSDRQRNITQSQGELQEALIETNRLQAGLNQKHAESRTAQLETQQRIQQLQVETTQLKAQLAETKNLLQAARTKLVQNFLYAPIDGYVSSLNIQNAGVVVQPGQTVAEMAPHNAPLVLSASLPNQEAGFVKPGMPVQVKLDAYPYQDYGVVPGKVTSISPDAKLDERLGAVYQLEVALERNYIAANQQKIKFKAGQTATAEVIIRRRRIIDILLDPIKQIQKGGMNL